MIQRLCSVDVHVLQHFRGLGIFGSISTLEKSHDSVLCICCTTVQHNTKLCLWGEAIHGEAEGTESAVLHHEGFGCPFSLSPILLTAGTAQVCTIHVSMLLAASGAALRRDTSLPVLRAGYCLFTTLLQAGLACLALEAP